MTRLDRYLLAQLIKVFGFFALVLVLVYWVNRAVVLFDQLIADGQSAAVFVEFTLLALPNVIRLVLPIAAVAAALYVTNRLSQDSELVALQAAGVGPYRLARPVLWFGALVGLLVALLVNAVVPASLTSLAARRGEIAENLAARLLREGEFLHPAPGVTLFIGRIGTRGELQDVFLSDTSRTGRHTTYTAQDALVVRTESGPRLVMFDGQVQTLERATRRLAVTRFEDFAYDLAGFLGGSGTRRRMEELSTPALLGASAAVQAEVRQSRARLLAEGHERIAQSTISVVAPLLGFGTLLIGGFTRFGIWRQILAAVIVVALVEMADTSLTRVAQGDARLWPLAYGGTLAALAAAAAMLSLARRPFALSRFRRAQGRARGRA